MSANSQHCNMRSFPPEIIHESRFFRIQRNGMTYQKSDENFFDTLANGLICKPDYPTPSDPAAVAWGVSTCTRQTHIPTDRRPYIRFSYISKYPIYEIRIIGIPYENFWNFPKTALSDDRATLQPAGRTRSGYPLVINDLGRNDHENRKNRLQIKQD